MTRTRRVLVDDIFLSISRSGIARVWHELLTHLADDGRLEAMGVELTVLNRSDQLTDVGFPVIDFPQYSFAHPAQDRHLLTALCHARAIDVFSSSYYTFVPGTPTAMMIYDFIPELFGFASDERGWLERQLALLQATSYVSISETTREDLHAYYPFVPREASFAAPLAANLACFSPRPPDEVDRFRRKHSLQADYWVMVGSRYQWGGYKNGGLVVAAMAHQDFPRSDIVFIGGEPITDEERLAAERLGVRLLRLDASDEELAVALTGTRALVYPTRYEGFGLPPLEALACGVPVITTGLGALRESVGGLMLPIGPDSPADLVRQLRFAAAPRVRAHFRQAGPEWAASFHWDRLVGAYVEAIDYALESSPSTSMQLVQEKLGTYTDKVRTIQS